jgi:hypothetical protein
MKLGGQLPLTDIYTSSLPLYFETKWPNWIDYTTCVGKNVVSTPKGCTYRESEVETWLQHLIGDKGQRCIVLLFEWLK